MMVFKHLARTARPTRFTFLDLDKINFCLEVSRKAHPVSARAGFPANALTLEPAYSCR
jgi:hypothetical protein